MASSPEGEMRVGAGIGQAIESRFWQVYDLRMRLA
jgi:hypothetical protein